MVRKKNPQQTRELILNVAAKLLHRHGYKGLRVDEVVEKTGLTKGALYHHFPNKKELAYAVVDELFYKTFLGHWQELLKSSGDPINVIAESFEFSRKHLSQDELEIGCPLTNLGQEMSHEDEGFRTRINNVFEDWTKLIADLLSKGIQQGNVTPDINPTLTARFLVSSYQGIQCNSKFSKDLNRYHDNVGYLQSIIKNLATRAIA
ncbi:TetR family transcriptional regulator C-terminal domain-containing protein [Aliikangiella maris]|uniref:TetR/AcrR family transcriptional regulator n=2 Tax=Aliikangiella maris TaxID=3162458 RepID=A0ABV2BQ02_9GAMM